LIVFLKINSKGGKIGYNTVNGAPPSRTNVFFTTERGVCGVTKMSSDFDEVKIFSKLTETGIIT